MAFTRLICKVPKGVEPTRHSSNALLRGLFVYLFYARIFHFIQRVCATLTGVADRER